MYTIFLIFGVNLHAQSTCQNSDFSMGDFTNWTGYTSVYPDTTNGTNINIPYYFTQGIVNQRHTIITNSTPDPFTCNNVMTIPPGENSSVRLGNGGLGMPDNGVRWQRDYLEYTISVTPNNALLIYKYAVVLQDPSNFPHDDPIKPRFGVSIFNDATGNLIDPVCGVYNVTSDTTVKGFRDCVTGPGNVFSAGDVRYRAWTTVGVDLRAYIGSNVTIRFETWDCGLGGHFGYAYISAKCNSMEISAQNCKANNTVTLTAPPGFSYLWSSGETTQTIDVPNAVSGDTVTVKLTTYTGCTSDVSIVLNPAVASAKFSTDADSVCFNEPINFYDSSFSYFPQSLINIPIIAWNWDFGDGNTSTQKNPTHIYTTTGTFVVTLEVETAEGCLVTITKDVEIMPLPVPDFVFNTVCVGVPTSFQDQSLILTGGIKDWQWNFDDIGSTSAIKSPDYTFSKDGLFNVKLITTSDFGCIDSIEKPVDVFSLPTANFSFNDNCQQSSVLFTNLSTTTNPNDSLDSYQWNFGVNSSLSNSVNPTYLYADTGTYSVSLNIFTDAGCRHDTILPITIYPKPLPDFKATMACANSPVYFSNLTPFRDSIVSWSWNFGDGSPTESQDSVNHIYANSGFYNVSLKATTNRGCVDSIVRTIEIIENPVAKYVVNNFCFGNPAVFTNNSYTNSGNLTNSDWTVSDGNTTYTNKDITHMFSNIGNYSVTLVVKSDLGCVDSITQIVEVRSAPDVNFIADTVCFGAETVFMDLTTPINSNYSWLWEFGDSSPNVSGQNQIHAYGAANTYMVKLTVINGNCFSDTVIPITVKPSPKADFSLPPFCMGLTRSPLNTSAPLVDISSWKWHFSDKNLTDSNQTPVHTFDITDDFDITLIAFGKNGCNDTLLKNINLFPIPVANFSVSDVCMLDTAIFRDISTISAGSVVGWSWDFGDGITSSLKNPVHAYSSAGVFNVELIVESNNGCFDTVRSKINVWELPRSAFSVSDICIGEYALFNNQSIPPVLDSIISNVWSFGDGSLQKEDLNPSYKYFSDGTYNVTLYITTKKGCKGSVSHSIQVHPKPILDFSPTEVCLNQMTTFKNLSTSIGAISTWSWDFGDRTSNSSDKDPIHTYDTVGIFDVSLKAYSVFGCSDSIVRPVVVYDLPEINFDVDHYHGCVPDCFDFADNSFAPLDTIISWVWDFGDGGKSTDQNPYYCYNKPGYFDISLEVSTTRGCVNIEVWDSMITIHPKPISKFSASPYQTTEANPLINFIDESSGAAKWMWDFGDGNTSDDSDPFNLYYNFGNYTVMQTVINEFGCRDSSVNEVLIDRTYQFFAPNSFSPNGDGINDVFFPETIGMTSDPSKYTFAIFNRWGELIWETHQADKGWDGKITKRIFGAKSTVKTDTYVWKVWIQDLTLDSEDHVFIGRVSIIR